MYLLTKDLDAFSKEVKIDVLKILLFWLVGVYDQTESDKDDVEVNFSSFSLANELSKANCVIEVSVNKKILWTIYKSSRTLRYKQSLIKIENLRFCKLYPQI